MKLIYAGIIPKRPITQEKRINSTKNQNRQTYSKQRPNRNIKHIGFMQFKIKPNNRRRKNQEHQLKIPRIVKTEVNKKWHENQIRPILNNKRLHDPKFF